MPLALEFDIDTKSRKVLINIEDLNKNTKKSIRRAFIFIGKDLRKQARIFVRTGPKTGRLYPRRRGRGLSAPRIFGTHQASSPGESPATETGRLEKSISSLSRGFDSIDFGASAKSDKGQPYANTLELGSPGGKIAPRPYLIRAIRERQKVTENYFRKEISLINKKI